MEKIGCAKGWGFKWYKGIVNYLRFADGLMVV